MTQCADFLLVRPQLFGTSRPDSGNRQRLLTNVAKASGSKYVLQQTGRGKPKHLTSLSRHLSTANEPKDNRECGVEERLLERTPDQKGNPSSGLKHAQRF